ncbi:MAG TPA: zinc ribbon domain-containing protein [Thermoplasmata archaeon]|nr:zinc ribbon domain-containing protein [Thermoplasmata archaeon]
MRRRSLLPLLVLALALAVPGAGTAGAHALPASGDHFRYYETIAVSQGAGNYTGYTENQFLNGSYSVAAVAPNGTAAVDWQTIDAYENNVGVQQATSDAGTFTFSPTTYRYVNGTDNQTRYVDPYVWFYMNNSLGNGSTFYLLNTRFTIASTTAAFAHSGSATGYVRTIFAEGTGSYQRDDSYGAFTATYDWKVYFDPATGYIVGYLYTEQDVDGSGNGFAWTDSLSVTTTSYSLASSPPPPAPPPAPAAVPYALVAALVVLVLVVVVAALWLRRRRTSLPRHSTGGSPTYGPSYGAPPPLDFSGTGQPPVQQIVIKETVKTKCAYCGTLIDTTATVCPKCGAPRT